MQAVSKVGAAGEKRQALLLAGLEGRFNECITEENWSLVQYDIVQGLRNLHDVVEAEKVKAKALELIEGEEDPKYRKEYASLWKAR